MLGLCLALGGALVALNTSQAELHWTHSVQKTAWHEIWRATPDGLLLTRAAVQGSGAGMEPGEDAVLKDGFWVWSPKRAPIAELPLTRSDYTGADWSICVGGACQPLGRFFPDAPSDATITLKTCGG
ncbi:DUF1850 domain-containing protein [Ferrovibrio sp.]|uniref:DUF1850 domain-containing protein n=1 Tax=Ferrovibrio sp. TaxID=1917215 RepID=UPI0035B39F7E